MARSMPPRHKIAVPRWAVPPPAQAGFYSSIGIPQGQLDDHRYAHPDGSGTHVHTHLDRYEIHQDEVDPSVNLLEHLRRDCPALVVGSLAVAGAVTGARMVPENRLAGALIGAGLCTLLGLLLVS